ncbi:hypothetical protein AMECASPLE_000010 [Ameca splendens]|uniref:Uncharacterized protein n=1 Tax=Ameca splendens TaxID=208324 RepID=A0ABV0XXF9_9TELE
MSDRASRPSPRLWRLAAANPLFTVDVFFKLHRPGQLFLSTVHLRVLCRRQPGPYPDLPPADYSKCYLVSQTTGCFQFLALLSSWWLSFQVLWASFPDRYRPDNIFSQINLLNYSDSPECFLHVGQIGS